MPPVHTGNARGNGQIKLRLGQSDSDRQYLVGHALATRSTVVSTMSTVLSILFFTSHEMNSRSSSPLPSDIGAAASLQIFREIPATITCLWFILKHDVDVLVGVLVLIVHIFFSNTRRIQTLQGQPRIMIKYLRPYTIFYADTTPTQAH